MNTVEVRAGDRILYVETERIDEIVMNPEIYKVPQADECIRGIAIHEGKLVVYYRFGDDETVRCGVLMKGKDEYRAGVPADEVTGGKVMDREELTLVVSGVWERKSD